MNPQILVQDYRKKYKGSLYFEYMRELADRWPGWHNGYDLWHIEQRDWRTVDQFCAVHDELRHATMLEF